MEIMDNIMHFIFNWATYFWSIPIWFIIWIVLVKYLINEKITVGILPLFLIISLMNPIWYCVLGISILMIPFIFLVVWFDDICWSKIKDKEIF